MNLTITPEQARMIADAEAAKQNAIRDASLVLSAMTAGLVPNGAVLTGCDVVTGVLTFAVPDAE